MHDTPAWPKGKIALYALLKEQLAALMDGCSSPMASMANCAALLWEALPNINWAGFYLLKGDTLLLGPFQGKIACTTIRLGRGVCGTAALQCKTQLVADVHQFPGHIACDSASNAEIVIPLIFDGQLYGVMDIDSPLLNRFDEEDLQGLEALCQVLSAATWKDGLL